MAQQPIEIILTRQLAEYLSLPIFVIDTTGDLVFYNEPAEKVLGARFEETGPMPAETWTRAFRPTDASGQPVSPDQLPPMRTLRSGAPASSRLWIQSLDGSRHQIGISAWPLRGHSDRKLGAAAMLWKVEE